MKAAFAIHSLFPPMKVVWKGVKHHTEKSQHPRPKEDRLSGKHIDSPTLTKLEGRDVNSEMVTVEGRFSVFRKIIMGTG